MSNIQPNQYTLSGGGITFTFLRSNFLGQPFASFSDGTQTRDYFGSAIRVLDVGIGTLVTVTTFMTIATKITMFNVM